MRYVNVLGACEIEMFCVNVVWKLRVDVMCEYE
jgi:hypothetical protein